MLVCASPVLAQTLGGAQAPDISMVRVVVALVACISIAAIAALAIRFKMTGRLDLPNLGSGSARRLVLVERLRLSAQHDLCLIAFEEREFIVSVSPAGIFRFDGGMPANDSRSP